MESHPADLMCVCIARHVRDGEILAQGLATPLVAAGYLLAWRVHAPHGYFASALRPSGGPGCGSPAGGIPDVTTVVDPLDVRQFEFLRGSRRREALELILRFERAD